MKKEASEIIEKLKEANEPFTLLIDAYTAERKKILDKEKARKQAILDAAQFESDHEMGLLINKTFEHDKAEERREQERKRKIADEEFEAQKEEAARQAAINQILINEGVERDKIHAENARLANVEHCAKVNRKALSDLLEQTDITSQQAKQVIQAIARGRISSTKINY